MSIRTLLLAAACAPALSGPMAALAKPGDPPVDYRVSFENAAHHEARISVAYRGVGAGPLELRMARSSPGRYALHEFAKNVYDVAAVDGAGKPLAITRKDPYSWIVAGHDGTVVATYTLFGDRADGTYSQIDTTHAHLNMPATFMWAKGFDDRSINVTFASPDPTWSVATQLAPTRGPMTFHAPNLQYFFDSPTELAPFAWREWQAGDADAQYTIRLAVHHNGDDATVDLYAEKAKRVVAEQIAMFGDAPDFDFGTYTFITDSVPHASGDGMEHRNSTIITDAEGLAESSFEQLGTLSHEFFHAWNVERIRPAELEPFDFTDANPTPSLWLAEGFTSYYGPLHIRRAGLSTVREYANSLAAQLNGVLRGTGRRFHSPQQMSLRAPFTDAATAVDPTNNTNIFVSYYPYGATVALALDLMLRQRFEAVTLDHYMRRLWRVHGVTEKPYTPDDLKLALAAITNDAAFSDDFFARFVEASALPDFAPLLDQAGLVLQPASPGAASRGRASFKKDGARLLIDSATRIGEPLYAAGLDRGDEIVSLGRARIDDEDDLRRAVARYKPGETAAIVFIRRGAQTTGEIIFAEQDELEIKLAEDFGREATAEQRAFREAWLGAESSGD